jgi:hypothetical protein
MRKPFNDLLWFTFTVAMVLTMAATLWLGRIGVHK